MIRDGVKVSYVGPEVRERAIGDEGKVLSGEAGYAHVQWSTGKCAGKVDMIRETHLVASSEDRVDDFEGPIIGIDVQATFQRRGSIGLINALSDEGHTMAFPQIAEEVLGFVSSRIREDPSFKEAMAQLDPEDAAEVIATASLTILREAWKGDRS